MGSKSGKIERMPFTDQYGRKQLGKIWSDDGGFYTFSSLLDGDDPAGRALRMQRGARVLFEAGAKQTARKIRLSRASHGND